MFWGCNLFLVQAESVEGLWPHPAHRFTDLINPDVWGDNWRLRVGVSSENARKMIRKLAWEFPYDSWTGEAAPEIERRRRLLGCTKGRQVFRI